MSTDKSYLVLYLVCLLFYWRKWWITDAYLNDLIEQKAASHFNEMTHAFRSQTQRFAEQVISDVKSSKPQEQVEDDQSPKLEMPTEKEPTDKEPHAYHEESRVSEFGTLRIFFFK